MEIGFFLPTGQLIIRVLSAPQAPPPGSIINIKRKDYTVKEVFWTVDAKDGLFALRATVTLEPRT